MSKPLLWQVMQDAVIAAPAPARSPAGTIAAAQIRALRDWLVPEEVPPLGPAGKAHMQLRALLTAEADRAERGEVEQ